MSYPVCTVCGKYAGTYAGKCGDCILVEGKQPTDYDPGLKMKQLQRQAEEKSGVFSTEMVRLAQMEVAEQPRDNRPGAVKHNEGESDG